MARRHRRRRDTFDVANRRLPFSSYRSDPYPYGPSPVNPVSYGYVTRNFNRSLSSYEDRRRWSPSTYRAPKTFSGSNYALVPKRINQHAQSSRTPSVGRSWLYRARPNVPARIGFSRPKRVLICVRRKQRKEVLHALRKTGKIGQKKPRFNNFSSIICRS